MSETGSLGPWRELCDFSFRRCLPTSWIVYDKVLGEFCRDLTIARRAYGRFVRAGIDEPPPSPFAAAVGGLLLGSEKFVSRIQRLIDARPADVGVPETKRLSSRPAVEQMRLANGKDTGACDGSGRLCLARILADASALDSSPGRQSANALRIPSGTA